LAGVLRFGDLSYIKFKDFLVLSSIAMIHQKVMKVAIQAQALLLQSQDGVSSNVVANDHFLTCHRWNKPCSCIVSA
jgi:hypothetical protein